MKRKSLKPCKLVISLILAALIGLSGYIGITSIAEGDITLSATVVGDGVNTIDGKTYAPINSNFMVNYTLTNNSEKAITVRVEEELKREDGKVEKDKATRELGNLGAGEKKTVAGREFMITSQGTSGYTINYTLQYMGENGEWINLPNNSGSKTVHIMAGGIDITYSASPKGPISQGGQVTYGARLKSTANIELTNIVVKDSVFGEIGRISTLAPGETKEVSATFNIDKTTKSYPIVSHDNPTGSGNRIEMAAKKAAIEVIVEEALVDKPLVIVGKVNKTKVSPNEEVDFSISVGNRGNKTLRNIKLLDWTGKELLSRDSLEPGKEATVIQTTRVEPGKTYEFKATAQEEGTGRELQAGYSVNFTGIEAKLSLTNRVVSEEFRSGDRLIIEYNLENTGKVSMIDIKINEPEFGQVARLDELRPGEEETFTLERILDGDTLSYPRVYGKDKEYGNEYEFKGSEIRIPVETIEYHPLLTLKLTSEPEILNEAGPVDIICTVFNEGDIKIDNIEVLLNERDINMGSILTLEPGDQETLTLPGIDIREDTVFTVTAVGITYDGEDVEFISQAYEIKIDPSNIDEEPDKENPKLSFLKKLLGVVGTLALATAGGIVYLIRDLRKGGKKRIRRIRRKRTS